MTRVGSKLRRKLNVLPRAERAQLLMAIERERDTLAITQMRLAMEAGVSADHYRKCVAAHGGNASPRLVVALLRALKTLRASESQSRDPSLYPAAYNACLMAGCEVFGIAPAVARTQLRRSGEYPSEPDWMKAVKVRRVALYLASTELGIRGQDIAQAAGMTPAAVSIALNKIESARDDDHFDAAIERAAQLVRGA